MPDRTPASPARLLHVDGHLARPDGAMPHRDTVPDDGARHPALLYVPAVWGLGPHLHGAFDTLAAEGALVRAVHPYYADAEHPGGLLPPGDSVAVALARAARLDPAAAAAAIDAQVAALRAHPRCSGRVVIVGVCIGGQAAFLAAARGVVDGAATWHGGGLGALLAHAPQIRCPLALDFAERDPLIPLAEVEQIRAAFAGRTDVAITVHPGAVHGFTHIGWPMHDPAAQRHAFAQVQALLRGDGPG